MDQNLDIIFFGDSLTFGYGVNKEDSWVYKTAARLNFTYLNTARNGDTTPSMLSRYYNDVLRYNPAKIFVMGGTNDLLLGRHVDSIIENIELMIKDAQNINSKIIIGIPPVIIGQMAYDLFSPSTLYDYAERELPSLKDKLIELSHKYDVEFINFYDEDLNHKELFLDGIHFRAEGHDIMFNKARQCLS